MRRDRGDVSWAVVVVAAESSFASPPFRLEKGYQTLASKDTHVHLILSSRASRAKLLVTPSEIFVAL